MLHSINSAIKFYLSKLTAENVSNPHVARRMLMEWGFDYIGGGCESFVFTRKGWGMVIKIWYNPHFKAGAEVFQQNQPKSFFADTLCIAANGFNIVLQPKMEVIEKILYDRKASEKRFGRKHTYERFYEAIREKFPVGDLGAQNVGYLNGRIVAFDWVWGKGHN